jgi:hypothetical protein
MPLLETKRTALGLLVLFYHFIFSVIHKLHGHAILLPPSLIPRLHERTIGSRAPVLNSPGEHKYRSDSTGNSQASTVDGN